MAYEKKRVSGIQRYLEAAANRAPIDSGLLMSGHRMPGNTGLQRVGGGIARMLAQPGIDEREKEYADAQQMAFKNGQFQTAAGNAAQNNDIDSAIKLAQVSENAKYRGAMLGAREQDRLDKLDAKTEEQAAMLRPWESANERLQSLYDTFDESLQGKQSYATQTRANRSGSSAARWFGGLGGESASERVARREFDNLKNTYSMNARETLRGTGQVSDKETELAIGNVERARDPYELEIAARELENRVRSKIGMPNISAREGINFDTPQDGFIVERID